MNFFSIRYCLLRQKEGLQEKRKESKNITFTRNYFEI
jgi:hypothetical protein